MKRNVKFVRYSSKIWIIIDEVDLDVPCGVCAWYIRNNNAISAYAIYILHNRHKFDPADETLKHLKPYNKGIKINCWEALYMNMIYKQGLLISEQQVTDTNPLFDLATVPRNLKATSPNSSSQLVAPGAHTPQDKSRSTSSIIQISNFWTIPYKFDIPFHITVQKSRCQTTTTHTKLSQVISVKHVQ